MTNTQTQQYANIVSDNGLAPNRWQAFIWTSEGLVHSLIYAVLGLSELIHFIESDILTRPGEN